MKKTLKKIICGGSLAAALAAISPAFSAMAWGPERTTFTNENPATYVTFNSITNNVKVGNETNFVRVREKGSGDFIDSVKVEPGKQYEVYIYYHNNASSNLGLKAQDTRVFSYFPGFIAANKTGEVGAKISASNAKPKSVWDEASFINESANGVMLKYVENSAKITNNTYGADFNQTWETGIPEDIFKGAGTLIGWGALDGVLPGCAEYSGVITYTVEVTQPSIYLSKMVSKDGVNYYDKISANIGDTVHYKVIGKNAGTEELNVTSLHDLLTSGLAKASDAKLKGVDSGDELTLDSFFTAAGNAVGMLGVGTGGWEVTYDAKITRDALQGEDCGKNKLINGVWASYTLATNPALGGIISNHAIVEVDVPCETPPEMPKTGVDGGEMLMTILVVASLMGASLYTIYGVQLMHRKDEMVVDNKMTGMGGQPDQEI